MKDCSKCGGDSTLPEDMPDIGWAGGISKCSVCGGINLWISAPPRWDTEYYEMVDRAVRKAEAEHNERVKKRISDPSRLP